MKENTLNKLKEEDAWKQLNQGERRTFKQTHIIRPNYEKPKEHTNKLR